MSLYTGKEIKSNNWVKFIIDDEVVKRVEELLKIVKQPTFYQYPMFEWEPGIPNLDDMAVNEFVVSDIENPEDNIVK